MGCRLGLWMLLLLLFPVQGRQKDSGGLRAGPTLSLRLGVRWDPEALARAQSVEDAVWLQRELGGQPWEGERGGRGRAEVSGPLLLALDTHLPELGLVGREGRPVFFGEDCSVPP